MSASETTTPDLDAMMVLLADMRDEIVEATKAIARETTATPDAEVKRYLEDIRYLLSHQQPPRRRWRHVWVAVLVGVGLLGTGSGWYAHSLTAPPVTAQARLMGQVDALLAQRYDSLPLAFQRALQALYTQAGFQAPGQRTLPKKPAH